MIIQITPCIALVYILCLLFRFFSIVSRKTIILTLHLSFYFFADCQCYLNGTIDGSNVCAKSYVSNGSCHMNQPGCKYGYNGHDCGTCDSELGYQNDVYGNCDSCIEQFFVAFNDSDGRPKCQGKHYVKHWLGSKLAYFR